jgi:hypothetical protein
MGDEHLLKVLVNRKHEEHLDLRQWAGNFDPERFDAKIATWQMREYN